MTTWPSSAWSGKPSQQCNRKMTRRMVPARPPAPGSAVMGRSEPGSEGPMEALVRASADPRDVSVGPNQHGSGSSDCTEHRKFPRTTVSSFDALNPIGPRSDVEGAGLTEIEQYRSGIVQHGEHAPWALGGNHLEIGHAAPEQRVSRAEVVANVQTRHHPGVSLARL